MNSTIFRRFARRLSPCSAIAVLGLSGAVLFLAMVGVAPTPVAAEGDTPAAEACAYLQGRVPPAVIQSAMANPDRVFGYLQPTNPNLGPGPHNPLRRSLTLANPNLVWSAIANPVIFKAGCPRPEGMP